MVKAECESKLRFVRFLFATSNSKSLYVCMELSNCLEKYHIWRPFSYFSYFCRNCFFCLDFPCDFITVYKCSSPAGVCFIAGNISGRSIRFFPTLFWTMDFFSSTSILFVSPSRSIKWPLIFGCQFLEATICT